MIIPVSICREYSASQKIGGRDDEYKDTRVVNKEYVISDIVT